MIRPDFARHVAEPNPLHRPAVPTDAPDRPAKLRIAIPLLILVAVALLIVLL